MNESQLKAALIIVVAIAATIYINKNYLHLEQKLSF